jgi:D-alanyl-D-alanine carboxypeptidase
MRPPTIRLISIPILFVALLFAALWVNTVRAASLDKVMDAARNNNFSGVILVGDDSKVLYEKAIGFADKAKKLPHSVDMPWRWASVSKQVTSVIVAQLAEDGRLSLDKTIADYLSPKQFSGRDASRITIRQLLQHTSGLPNPDDVGKEASANKMPIFYRTKISHDRVHEVSTRAFCSGVSKRAPGEQFEYNNCDYLVLGAIIEQVTGGGFHSNLAKRIARGGTLRMAQNDTMSSQKVVGYLDTARVEPRINLVAYGAAGAMTGTPRDLLAFDRALMGNDLLSANMKREFWKGDPKLGYAALGVWAFPAPLKGCKDPVDLIERRGEIGGVQVRNIIAPQLKKAVVVFVNRADWEFGEIWQGKGFSHDLLSAALCNASVN